MTTGIIRTVLGDIPPDELGMCAPHEHLIGQPPQPYATQDPDLVLDSVDNAESELHNFRQSGGRALVEMTPIDYARDATSLAALSRRTDVHIICITGYLKDKFCAAHVESESVQSLTERFIKEIEVGIDETNIRAGALKAASSLNTLTGNERKVFEAVAEAHKKTGALISTHTEAGTMALEQIDLLTGAGVHPSRILIGHLDRKLDWEYHLAVAERGVYMGIDQISKEKYAPDSHRADFIVRLIEAGHIQQMMLSTDIARRSGFSSYGGAGSAYLFNVFVPILQKAGLDDTQIKQMMVSNPANALRLHTRH